MDRHDRRVEFLLWAAGLGRETEPPEPIDGEAALAGIRKHRIAGRFLSRADPAGATIPPELRAGARLIYDEQMATVARVDADVARLSAEIRRDPLWDGEPVLLLKGNAASYFFNRPSMRRYTGDLDVLTADCRRYGRIIENIGYRQRVNDSCHEFGNYGCEGRLGIDLHEYYPVWSYPAEPYWSTASGRAEIRMSDWITCDRLDYRTVLETSVAHPGDNCEAIRVPGLTMTVFILCVHIFRDYIEPPFAKPVAKVRLNELVEIRDLALHEAFDPELLASLVRRHRADDALSFVCGLLRELKALPDALGGVRHQGRAAFPQDLAFGLLADIGTTVPDMIVRRDTLGSVDKLGTPVRVALHDTNSVLLTVPSRNGSPVPAFRSAPPRAPSDEAVEFDCRITVTGDDVVFDIHSEAGAGPYLDEVFLSFGNEFFHAAWDAYGAGFRHFPDASDGRARWTVDSDGWRVVMRVPLAGMLRHETRSREIPLLICCTRFIEKPADDWNDFFRRCVSSACVPVTFSVPAATGMTEMDDACHAGD